MTRIRQLVEWESGVPPEGSRFDWLLGYLACESRCVASLIHTRAGQNVLFFDSGDRGDIADRNRKSVRDVEGAMSSLDKVEEVVAGIGAQDTSSVLLDITSMPRPVIARVLDACFSTPKKLELSIVYNLAKYTAPRRGPHQNVDVTPVHPRFVGWMGDPHRPLSAVVGLGYERLKALGAVEYLQISDRWLFSPESKEVNFADDVATANRQLLKTTPESQRQVYNVHAPLATLSQLDLLVGSLKRTCRPVLLPFGPKIFFVLSLITAAIHREASVWHVLGEEGEPKTERAPSGHVIGLSLTVFPHDQGST